METVDTRVCEQRGHEGTTSAFVTEMTGNDPKHWDSGEIKQGGGNLTGKQRKSIAALKEYGENGNIALSDGRITHKQRAQVHDAQPVQHRQTTMSHWRINNNSIGNHTNNDRSPVHTDDFSHLPSVQQQELTTIKRQQLIDEIKLNRQQRVGEMNKDTIPSRTPHQIHGNNTDQVISFEHINVHGLNPHDGFIELKNTMGILGTMEADIFSLVETQWDTTNPRFCKFIKDTIKKEDKYARVEIGSN